MKNQSIHAHRTLDALGWFAVLAMVMAGLHQPVMAAQSPVDLGSAATFGVLAATTITSTGKTIVYGDLGLSPGASLTGAPVVYGMIHLNDPAAAQAQTDLTIAYNDAAGRTNDAIPITGDLGGQDLPPGRYTSAATMAITTGNLTLDAHGDPKAVWIFAIGSTLTTAPGSQVILNGGARAANIYWQVGTSATLGTASIFKGSILAAQSITVTTGVALDGHVLAQNGTVTLDNNIIGEPPAPRFGSIAVASDGSVLLLITNTPLLPLLLQTSTNLVVWKTVATLTPGVSPYAYTDVSASGQPLYFYRALYP